MLPLDGYTVIDLSVGIAGAYCTKLLADGGATVVKVEPPEGDPLRRWSASGAEIKAGDDGALFSFLACSKDSVVVDPANADDLTSSRPARRRRTRWCGRAGRGRRARRVRAAQHSTGRYPHLTVTSITPFGLEGPWADRPATEFTVQAWSGGVIGLGRGAQDRAPLFVAGQIGEWLAGALCRRGHDGSAVGPRRSSRCSRSQILCLTYYSVSFIDALGRPFRDRRRLTIPGVATAADGLVALGCGTAQQWFDLCAMTGHDEWIDEESATLHHRTGQHPRRGDLRVGAREQRRRDPRPVHRVPHSQRARRKRRQRHLVRPVRRTGCVRHQSARRVHSARSALPRHSVARCVHRSPLLGSASTPTTTAEIES